MQVLVEKTTYAELKPLLAASGKSEKSYAKYDREHGQWFKAVNESGDFLGSVLMDGTVEPGVGATVQCEYVVPSYRSQGVAQAMVEAIRKEAIDTGLTYLLSYVRVERVHPKLQAPFDRFNSVVMRGDRVALVRRDVRAAAAAAG